MRFMRSIDGRMRVSEFYAAMAARGIDVIEIILPDGTNAAIAVLEYPPREGQ